MFGKASQTKKASKPNRKVGGPRGKKTGQRRFTTRQLAALDFLRNIPMKNELAIRERGIETAKRANLFDGGDEHDEDGELRRYTAMLQQQQLQALQYVTDDYGALPADAVGTKLQGPPAPTARVPLTFRYKSDLISTNAAVVRNWEEGLLKKSPKNPYPILNSRVFVSRARAYPMACFSVIGYDPHTEQARIEKQKAEDLKGTEVFELPSRDWRGFSYKPLFKAISEDYAYESGYMYNPSEIDDPDMLHASNKFTAQRSFATGPVISSVTLFVNEQTLKEELNEQFREGHSNLPPSLTLSKIRNLKRAALLGVMQLRMEVSTLAIAVISMERLIMKGLVTKTNRRLSMAVCLLLAFKMNETVNSHFSQNLTRLLDFIDQEWHVSRKELFEAEFGAYIHLNFSLHLPAAHLFVMCTRLLRLVNKSLSDYLGEEMSRVYTEDFLQCEKSKGEEREDRRKRRVEEEERRERERAREEGKEDMDQEEDEEDMEEEEALQEGEAEGEGGGFSHIRRAEGEGWHHGDEEDDEERDHDNYNDNDGDNDEGEGKKERARRKTSLLRLRKSLSRVVSFSDFSTPSKEKTTEKEKEKEGN